MLVVMFIVTNLLIYEIFINALTLSVFVIIYCFC